MKTDSCRLHNLNFNKPVHSAQVLHVEEPANFKLGLNVEVLLDTEGKGENSQQICDNCSLFIFQYFMTMLFSLAVVAWIGQQVHNLFLTYLIGECTACRTGHFLLAA